MLKYFKERSHIMAEQQKIDPNWEWGLGYRHAEGAAEHGEHELYIARFNNANRAHN